MLINNEIIEKLTTKQKIALLTDTYEAIPELKEQKIPSLVVSELCSETVDENREAIFPSFSSLANSWDEQLFGEATHKIACLKAEDGANLFILPKTNAAQSIYGKEISEDPYLAGTLFAGATQNLQKSGVAVCMQAPTVTKNDVSVMDNEADHSVLFERVARPFKMAKRAGRCEAFLTNQEEISDSYQIANKKMISSTIEDKKIIITKLENGDNTVAVINKGYQVLGGSNVALETAYDNYNRIYHSMEEGGATAHELEMALLDGAATSDEILDNALDQKISLAKKCVSKGLFTTNVEINHYAKECAKKSIVLVKNKDKCLPLQGNTRVALIGDIISNTTNGQYFNFVDRISSKLRQGGCNIVGYEQGYTLNEDVSKEQITSAYNLASKSDVAIVFLGLGKEREDALDTTHRLCLPANQIAMISALEKLNKKIIAVICGSRLPNMSFDGITNAVLLVPSQGKAVANALGEILTGKFNPEGRLAYAGYDNMDTQFRELQRRKKKGEQKIGQFIGYRYTDIAKTTAKYPFGHGLSYTKFTYSAVRTNSRAINFTVQNSGNIAGCETVQIYVRCDNSARLRPIKELKALCKVYLNPKQKKSLTVNLDELSIYDTDTESFVTEGGQYTVYVGSSASDIRLEYKIQISGSKLKARKQNISDYLHEVSNILSESYTMEAHCKPMNNVSKLKTLSAWLFVLTIFADIVYGVCGLLFGLPFKEQIGIFITLNAISISIALILFIVYGATNAKAVKEQKKKEKLATAELFRNAQKINARAVEKLFVDEFDQFEQEQAKKVVTYKGETESIYVYMTVETDFQALCKDMESHFANHGMVISPVLAKMVVSSLMSSRLLVLRNADKAVSTRFAQILSSFFGTTAFVESQSGKNWEKDTLLYSSNMFGIEQRQLAQAFYKAQAEKQKSVFYTMTDVKLEETASFLMPYVQFLGNPLEAYTVTENSTNFEIPSNIWFLMVPEKDESLDSMPAFISNLASVIDLDVEETEAVSQELTITVRPITPQQLEALKYRSKKAASIDEQVWKSVDTLEEFVNERTPYHIGNKIFLQLEAFLAVYMSCGGVMGEAVDGMLSAKLLPTIMSMLKGNAQMAEVDFVQTIESIFGEEYIERSSKIIKHLVVAPKESKNIVEQIIESQSAETVTDKTVERKEGDAKNAE